MKSLKITHDVHAERAEVFAACTDADRLQRWFEPGAGYVPVAVETDPKVGGGLQIELRSPSSGDLIISGRYLELRMPEKIVFSFRAEALDSKDTSESSTVSLELVKLGPDTRIIMTHDGLQGNEMELLSQGWRECLSRLPQALDRAHETFFQRVTRGPSFRSRFGGLWPDRTDAEDLIAGKLETGLLDEEEAETFKTWVEKGFVQIPGAVPESAIDRMLEDVGRTWQESNDDLFVEHYMDGKPINRPIAPELEARPHKLIDFHGFSQASRDVIFSGPIRKFLIKLFERPPMAFQSLLFTYGTEQDMHQDTAYVAVSSPMELVGCWIALEDIQPGTGELQYYEGSHRISEHLWLDRSRAKPYDYMDEEQHARFLASMHSKPRELGLPLVKFLPRKGDALIWHADLVHGGSKDPIRQSTRRSFVAHFCPVNCDPEWFATTPHSGRLKDASGCYYTYMKRSQV